MPVLDEGAIIADEHVQLQSSSDDGPRYGIDKRRTLFESHSAEKRGKTRITIACWKRRIKYWSGIPDPVPVFKAPATKLASIPAR